MTLRKRLFWLFAPLLLFALGFAYLLSQGLVRSRFDRQDTAQLTAEAERLRALAANPERWPANASLTPAQVRRGLQARRRRRVGIAASWVFAFVIGGGAGWQMRELRPSPSALPMADAVAAYRQFAEADAPPMEFDTARADDLQRWLLRHFGEAGRVPDLSQAGYRLMGGRLL